MRASGERRDLFNGFDDSVVALDDSAKHHVLAVQIRGRFQCYEKL
jgi:hypothetical protein